MDPTIPDGSLLVSYSTIDVSQGDIITFYSDQSESLITHRIVGEDEEGLITQGDNNPTTDQEIGISPLTQEQVRSKAVNFGGSPLYIPYLGTIVLLIQSNLIPIILLILIGQIGISLVRNRISTYRVHSNLVAKDIFQPLFIIVILVLTIVFIITATTISVPFVFTDNEATAQQQYVININEEEPTEKVTVTIDDSTLSKRLYVTNGFEIIERPTRNGSETTFTVRLPEQDTTGSYRTSLTIYKIPPGIPTDVAQQLVYISPVLPSGLSSIILILPFYLIYRFYIGPSTPIRNTRISRIIEKYN